MLNKIFSVLPLDVAGAITEAFESEVKPQFMSIVNSVVMPIICGVLLVVLIVKGVFAWKEYRNQSEVHWGVLVVLFICVIVAVSATAWMWTVIGW